MAAHLTFHPGKNAQAAAKADDRTKCSGGSKGGADTHLDYCEASVKEGTVQARHPYRFDAIKVSKHWKRKNNKHFTYYSQPPSLTYTDPDSCEPAKKITGVSLDSFDEQAGILRIHTLEQDPITLHCNPEDYNYLLEALPQVRESI